MKLSLNWVKHFTEVEIGGDELIQKIGSQLGAIEDVQDWGSYYDEKIVIAKITSAKDHEDADKLGVYNIDIGGGQSRQLVAGDKSLEVGDKVGYIPPGVAVPLSVYEGEPFVIGERDLRGITSQGMLGSAKELLFSDNHKNVLKLDTDKEVGSALVDAYELDDLIIDIENKMFTHRPDLFGILGLAREVAGIQGIEFSSPDWYSEDVDFAKVDNKLPLEVTNEIPELCPRFTAVALSNITIKPSPLIMQSYLNRVGLRPINNVVDITNYYMYLTSQPAHAFDYDKVVKLSGEKPNLVVRKPRKDEKIKLLDGREIAPHSEAAMVATDLNLLSVGGSIGGADSEVDDDTKTVILEVASWNLYSIRRTSFKHGIFTDAVARFNKGQSDRQNLPVLKLMMDQFVNNCDAKQASDIFDLKKTAEAKDIVIELSSDFVNSRLGSNYSAQDIAKTLNNVELNAVIEKSVIKVTVPFWRTDLELREDIVEEVGRLNGYDLLPQSVPLRPSQPNFRSDKLQLKSEIKRILASAGANEVVTYNFVSSAMFAKLGYQADQIERAYHLRNSLSPDLEYMRMSLLPSIVEKVNPNMRTGHKQFALFEVNKSHNKDYLDDVGLPKELDSLAMVVVSNDSHQDSSFFATKRQLEYLAVKLGKHFSYHKFEQNNDRLAQTSGLMFATSRRAVVKIDDQAVGYIGEFSSRVKKQFKLPEFSAGFEIDLNHLFPEAIAYKQISKFPVSNQDLTLSVPNNLGYAQLSEKLGRLFNEAQDIDVVYEPISIFRSKLKENRHISFHLIFQSPTRTLKTTEVNDLISRVVKTLEQKDIKQV